MIAEDTKPCAKCGKIYPLSQFYKQKSGPKGRHSYCKTCYNSRPRSVRKTQAVRLRNYWTKYRMRPDQYNALLNSQNGLCAACEEPLKRPCVDHCHESGQVRGILCHRCNIGIGFIEKHPSPLNLLGYVANFNIGFRNALEQEAERVSD